MAIPAVLAAIVKPLLGNGLNLVGNAVLAKGKDWVEQKLGVELKPDMTSDEIIRLKQAEMEHEEELLKLKLESDKLGLQQLEMYLGDVDSARDRESSIATSKDAPILNKIVTPVLALTVIGLTFILFAIVMFDKSPVEPSRKDILVYVLGALTAIATQVTAYYFGSSSGSKDKAEEVDEMSAVDSQAEFLLHAATLILKATEMGFVVTGGELARTPEQQQIYIKTGRSRTMNSLHLQRRAIDLNFFKDGKLTYDKNTLAPLGLFWESLHPLNSWGGNGIKLVDTPHFSRGDTKPEWRRVSDATK
jgi:hypothetical protein